MIAELSIISDVTTDISNIISAVIYWIFWMFGQLVSYLISSPAIATAQVLSSWGSSFQSFGWAIPIIFVSVLAITGFVLVLIIQFSRSIEDFSNPVEDMA